MYYLKINQYLNKKNLITLLIGILLYSIIVIGSTYAYLYSVNTNTNTLTGNLGTADIDLSVERVVPTTSKPLVPLKDEALSKALNGTGGISSCIDANNNLSCEVYKITIENTGSTNLQLNSTIALVAKETGTFQNLKWRELTNPTTIKEDSVIKPMAQSILEGSFLLGSGASRTYYIAVWISETNSNQLTNDTGDYGGIVRVTSVLGEGVTAKFGDIPEIGASYIQELYNDESELTVVDLDTSTTNVANTDNTQAIITNMNKIRKTNIINVDTSTTNTKVYLNPNKGIMLDNNGEYRYYGANPNNYVNFNGELWRIISVSNVKSSLSDTSGETRIKIIRNDSIGTYAWDSSDSTINSGKGINDWSQADLMTELNTLYYNKQSGTCYNGLNNASTTCDFTQTGLNEISKTLIDNAVWYLGVGEEDSRYGLPNLSYNNERSSKVYNGNPTIWTGRVALLYPSDYGYMSDLNLCKSTLVTYNTTNCKNTNWIANFKHVIWTISSFSSQKSRGLYIDSTGLVTENYICGARRVYPTVYLKSDIIITGGTGTSTDPYTIA